MPKSKEEAEFQQGIKQTGWYKEYKKEYGEEPNLDTKEYDYRKAWKAGVRPERDPYDNNRYHWGSSDPKTGEMLKSKDHPTAWKEDYMKKTGKNPDAVGVTKEEYKSKEATKMARGGLGLKDKVGTPTGEFSKVGKPIFLTEDGENVSEKSMTIPYKDKWINIPSIHKGVRYSEDEIVDALDKKRLEPTSIHDSLNEAEKAAQERSPALMDSDAKKILGRKVRDTEKQTKKLLNMAEGGMLQEGGSVDEVSGNKVPVGAMKEEVRDDIPAQLSEGEFVFPADVVRYIGLERLMQMRQAAKKGLMQMEDMGQMSNGEDGSEEEDTAEFESQIDDIMGEMGSDNESELEMNEGGMAQQPMQEAAPQQPATPEVTPEQMTKIQETAQNMRSQQGMFADLPPSQPTEGLKTSDIIKGNFTPEKQQDAEMFLSKVDKLARAKRVIVTRHNDTVVVGFVKRPGVLDPFLFSNDSPEKLNEAIQTSIEVAKKSGITTLESDSKGNIEMLTSLGYPVQETETGWTLNLQ